MLNRKGLEHKGPGEIPGFRPGGPGLKKVFLVPGAKDPFRSTSNPDHLCGLVGLDSLDGLDGLGGLGGVGDMGDFGGLGDLGSFDGLGSLGSL